MEKQFYQIYNELGEPVTGHIFRSPDGCDPVPAGIEKQLPYGWTYKRVNSADEIIVKADPVIEEN